MVLFATSIHINTRYFSPCTSCSFLRRWSYDTVSQKQNFYLFCTDLFDNGFKAGTWNFLKASHGNGAADGVGGVLAICRQASQAKHRLTKCRCCIYSTEQVFVCETILDRSGLAEEAIGKLNVSICCIPKTMSNHQLVCVKI